MLSYFKKLSIAAVLIALLSLLVVSTAQPVYSGFFSKGTPLGGSGLVSLNDGSAGAPSLSFVGDPNTGIYWVGADQFGLAAGGSVVAYLNANGFSIGAVSPTKKLTAVQTTANPGDNVITCLLVAQASETGSANSNVVQPVYGEMGWLATNTQNWTNSWPSSSFRAELHSVAGATGTIAAASGYNVDGVARGMTFTKMAGYWCSNFGATDGGVITNLYGYYCATLSAGGTNWAFYALTNPSYFGGGATFASTLTLGENAVLLDESIGTDHYYSGTTCEGIAGMTVATGEVVMLADDDKWDLTDADAGATADGMLGLVITGGNDTDPILILLYGFMRDDSAFDFGTGGAPLFLSVTAGALSETAPVAAPDIVRVAAYAHDDADTIFFWPDPTWVEIS